MKIRPRRLRTTAVLRESVAETHFRTNQLIQPHFVSEDENGVQPIDAMPGIARMGIKKLVERVGLDLDLGLTSVLLFGLTEHKDARGSSSTDPKGLIPRAVRALRERFGDKLIIATDVCLCGSMDHGHCGVLKDGKVLNDETLPILAAMALAHAKAGADIVAPSDMMDGRVTAIREELDRSGYSDTALLSYSTKFASAFYGPFREAADSAPKSGDRKSYQMDHRNAREALRESLLDEAEGADMLMVKPGLPYLDVVHRVKQATGAPLAAYHVSGEYSMLKAAVRAGWLDERAAVLEALTSIRRAGADAIITYYAKDAANWLDD